MMLWLIAALAIPQALMGQSRPDELRFHLGTATFFEADQHFTAGGSYRKYFGKRGWGIEPEYSAMVIPAHVDNMLTVSLVKDLSKPTSKRVWYILMGGGVNYQVGGTWSEPYFPSALAWGVGMKSRLGKRTYIAPQVRIGWEPNIRFSVFIGRMVGKGKQ